MGIHVKLMLFLLGLMKLELWQILEKYSNIKFHEIHPVGAELFHVDRLTNVQTDMLNLTVTFHNFANVPKDRWEGSLVGVDIHNFGTKWKPAISCTIFLYFLVPTGKTSNDSHW